MATFGYTNVGISGWSDFCDVIMGYHAAPANGDGIVDNIKAYIRNIGAGNHNAKVAIYSYVGPGDAGSPIANGQSDVLVVTPDAGSWHTFTFSTPPSVINGTQYFLLIWGDGEPGEIHIAYDSGGAAGIGLYLIGQEYGAWPDPLAGETSSTAQRSIYVTYTPTGGTPIRVATSRLMMGIGYGLKTPKFEPRLLGGKFSCPQRLL